MQTVNALNLKVHTYPMYTTVQVGADVYDIITKAWRNWGKPAEQPLEKKNAVFSSYPDLNDLIDGYYDSGAI